MNFATSFLDNLSDEFLGVLFGLRPPRHRTHVRTWYCLEPEEASKLLASLC